MNLLKSTIFCCAVSVSSIIYAIVQDERNWKQFLNWCHKDHHQIFKTLSNKQIYYHIRDKYVTPEQLIISSGSLLPYMDKYQQQKTYSKIFTLFQKKCNFRKTSLSIPYSESPTNFSTNFLVFVNSLIFCCWHIPNTRFQELMSKNFLGGSLSNNSQSLLFSSFSHRSPTHFFLNMYALRSLSKPAIAIMGAPRMVSVYFCGGAMSSLLSAFINIIRNRYYYSLGASGSVMAIIGAISYSNLPSEQYSHTRSHVLRIFRTLIVGDVISMMIIPNSTLEHTSHLVGAGMGVLCAIAFRHLPKFPKKNTWKKTFHPFGFL